MWCWFLLGKISYKGKTSAPVTSISLDWNGWNHCCGFRALFSVNILYPPDYNAIKTTKWNRNIYILTILGAILIRGLDAMMALDRISNGISSFRIIFSRWGKNFTWPRFSTKASKTEAWKFGIGSHCSTVRLHFVGIDLTAGKRSYIKERKLLMKYWQQICKINVIEQLTLKHLNLISYSKKKSSQYSDPIQEPPAWLKKLLTKIQLSDWQAAVV